MSMSIVDSSRDLVRKTLTFDSPERIPRQAWILPWAEARYPQFVRKLQRQFPDDLVSAPALYTAATKDQKARYRQGQYVDDWGCVFTNPQEGIIGIVKEPLLARWEDLDRFQTPDSVLQVDTAEVNWFCRNTTQYVLSGSVVRPFERLQFIRTMEQALIDLMEQPPGSKSFSNACMRTI